MNITTGKEMTEKQATARPFPANKFYYDYKGLCTQYFAEQRDTNSKKLHCYVIVNANLPEDTSNSETHCPRNSNGTFPQGVSLPGSDESKNSTTPQCNAPLKMSVSVLILTFDFPSSGTTTMTLAE